MLVRLLYASRCNQPISQEFMDTLLSQCRTHNPQMGITGILCWGDDVFLQVLEGGRMAVNSIYNQIVQDPRHRDVILLSYQEIAERRFAGWTMGQVNLTKVNPSLLLKHSEKPTLDPYAVTGRASMALLEDLIATASIIGRP